MRKATLIGLGMALVVAALLGPLASPLPDGLERVAEDHGVLQRAYSVLKSPLPDYLIPGVDSEALGTALSGLVGTLLVFGLVWGVGRLLRARERS